MRPLDFILIFLTMASLFSCRQNPATSNDYWALTMEQRDSLDFIHSHHYGINYNFTVTADSIQLESTIPNQLETAQAANVPYVVRKHNTLVVADITYILSDSTKEKTYYIKVARDQETMGWIKESELLKKVVPCDPISQFIHTFSNSHIYFFCVITAIALLFFIYYLKKHRHIPFVHFQDIDSFYPTLLCTVTALAATLYGSMQKFSPELWAEYYYSPSLNPIGQPFILAAFLLCVWLILIAFIATLDEVTKQLKHTDMISYLSGLSCVWLIIYVVFSQSVKIYIGYPLFLVYVFFAVNQYRRHHIAKYICGQCGRPLRSLGECPYCHTFNK